MITRLVILFFLPVLMLAQYRDIPDVVTKVATSAGGFLKLETSARAIGMGGAFVAAGRGYLDDIIMPRNTRRRIARALVMLADKQLENPPRKHDNLPL